MYLLVWCKDAWLTFISRCDVVFHVMLKWPKHEISLTQSTWQGCMLSSLLFAITTRIILVTIHKLATFLKALTNIITKALEVLNVLLSWSMSNIWMVSTLFDVALQIPFLIYPSAFIYNIFGFRYMFKLMDGWFQIERTTRYAWVFVCWRYSFLLNGNDINDDASCLCCIYYIERTKKCSWVLFNSIVFSFLHAYYKQKKSLIWHERFCSW